MRQFMVPERTVFQAGEVIHFQLMVPGAPAGEAFLRTTLTFGAEVRREIVAATEEGRALGGIAWHDFPMSAAGNGDYIITLPLLEPGVFEAKCLFRPAGGGAIRWPEGGNFRLKVVTAANLCGNSIYCAFVRQFGSRGGDAPAPEELARLDREGYTVIPPSGTFRDLVGHLDHIFNTLNFRILQLLPIHPAPTVYGRMGRYGSPFAALDYFAVDPALAEFDRSATPYEQFLELVDAVHARRGRIFLDIPVNHTGWASRLQNDHPEYFVRRADGEFESPGAWGVVWEDLCKLNYADDRVHRLMAEVFLHWCRAGVDGFRCDAGYMLPLDAWRYIVARVRDEYPDTVFLLEGLGGKLEVQEALLGVAGLDWAYSELFQNYSRAEIERYYPYLDAAAHRFGALVNFAETHDNNRLAASGHVYAAMRCALSALLSSNGTFGITNGVEFFAADKIDVHGNSSLNREAGPNLIPALRRLNTLLQTHSLFRSEARVALIGQGDGNFLAALRHSGHSDAKLLVLVNLDLEKTVAARWRRVDFDGEAAFDLLTGREAAFRFEGELGVCALAPGEAHCFTFDRLELERLEAALAGPPGEPAASVERRATVLALALLRSFRPAARQYDAHLGLALRREPVEFCRRESGETLPPVTVFTVGRDERRLLMLPPGELLLLRCAAPFRAELRRAGRSLGGAQSLPALDGDGGEFTFLFPPAERGDELAEIELHLAVYGEKPVRRTAGVLLLPPFSRVRYHMQYGGREALARRLLAFAANGRGGMTYTRAAWSELGSKYEALLAANGPAPHPVDRRVLFTRCRGFLVANGYSQAIDGRKLTGFAAGDNTAEWRFVIPSGQGRFSHLAIELAGALDGDAVRLRFRLAPGAATEETGPVKIILRPDLEDRNFHTVTKAFLGPEQSFPASVRAAADSFVFGPDERLQLRLALPGGRFVPEPEWQYLVNLPEEEYYGLEHATDLFSPGYFEFELSPGESRELFAAAAPRGKAEAADFAWPPADFTGELRPAYDLKAALRPYLVDRDGLKTVIAGYPWFLDWGRDTFIALRGYIATGFREESAAILREFASFEERGTIPNVIHGLDTANRDTSDAPLWLLVAARDYLRSFGDEEILEADCRGRKFLDILCSIVEHYRRGTPNGIRMDADSGLVFSPVHFTWMDTSFPAGTPREGYPVEIQALWVAGLDFLGAYRPEYAELAEQAAASLERYFFRPELGRFSDCLHGAPGVGAAAAVPDDHLRPNQLLAVTLGAVRTPELARRIVESSAELLIPGAIRSLADRPVAYRLPVERDGRLLNDPERPYRGRYCGPEDTSRKVAYHNGTAWGWPFPSYCEALYLVGGESCRQRALALLGSTAYLANQGIPGQLPEIADGDAPHRPGGCLAQAWSVAEAARVFVLLHRPHDETIPERAYD